MEYAGIFPDKLGQKVEKICPTVGELEDCLCRYFRVDNKNNADENPGKTGSFDILLSGADKYGEIFKQIKNFYEDLGYNTVEKEKALDILDENNAFASVQLDKTWNIYCITVENPKQKQDSLLSKMD